MYHILVAFSLKLLGLFFSLGTDVAGVHLSPLSLT